MKGFQISVVLVVFAVIEVAFKCDGKLGDVERRVIVAYTGTPVSFKCEGDLNTAWWYNDRKERLNSNVVGELVIYTIPRVSERDTGEYVCSVVEVINGRTEEWFNPVTLYVAEREEGAVKISPRVAHLGQRVQFECDYDNNIAWFIERTTQLPESPPISGDKSYSLVVQEQDSGFYLCYGAKADGKHYISKEYLEVINYKIPAIRQYGKNYFDWGRDVWCSICLNNVEDSESIRRLSKCQHDFHEDCIKPWLERNNQCPVCREEVADEDMRS